jgi:uncharacterized protein (TIGR02679 family)
MSRDADDRLRRLLGGDHLTSLRRRLRHRFERADPGVRLERFRISQLTPDEYATLASLLGRSQRFSKSIEVDVSDLDAALHRSGIAASLRAALENLDGPITHPASLREQRQARWSAIVNDCVDARLLKFLRASSGLGLLKRLSRGEPDTATVLRRRSEAVLRKLPAHGLTRAQLAADTLGDAHALDNGRAEATLVLAVWRVAAGSEDIAESLNSPGVDDLKPPKDLPTETVREIWAKAGVLVNELARPALFLNLPIEGDLRLGIPGEPGYLSLRMLLRLAPRWAAADRRIYVCENPNLLAIAADRLQERCPPMVCTEGMPAAAQSRLLSQLAGAGAQLLYHGDFDWPGVRIGNHVMRIYNARPWRYGAADYVAAIQAAPRRGHALRGAEVSVSWDLALRSAMREHGLGIPEEAVASSLLDDLEESSNNAV